MAFSRVSLVADKTSTGGAGSYTLDDPVSPGDGLRTLADAVASGHVTAGDTVSYWVKDTTTQGAALQFEHGIGTVGAGGNTLSRTTIIESSNSNNAVYWSGGGSRTVVIGLGASGLALLAAAQTFTAAQTFSALLTASAGLTSSGTTTVGGGASPVPLDLRSTNTSGSAGRIRFGAHNASAVAREYGEIRTTIEDATAASEDARFVMFLYKAGANTEVFRFNNDGTILDVAGSRTFAYQGVLDAPSGQQLLSFTTPPTGWTRVNVTGERMVKLAGTADTLGATGGSWVVSGLSGTMTSGITVTVDGHTLTTGEIPAHGHDFVVPGREEGTASGSPKTGFSWDTANQLPEDFNSTTANAGGGGSHTHTASAGTAGDTTVDSSGTWRPAFEIGCVMQKS